MTRRLVCILARCSPLTRATGSAAADNVTSHWRGRRGGEIEKDSETAQESTTALAVPLTPADLAVSTCPLRAAGSRYAALLGRDAGR